MGIIRADQTLPAEAITLTPFEQNILPSLLQRFFVTRALDVAKMKDFVPCEVDDRLNNYKATITKVVYDPLAVPEVNARYRDAGYVFDDGNVQVIAETADGEILLWGGLNSVFHLAKGDRITGAFDEQHLAFNDILHLTNRFKIKNKKVEIDALIAALKAKYGKES